jgi:glucarate dehydratase
VTIPRAPGLGIQLDEDRLLAAHQLYQEHALGARDDSAGMQYLLPGWTFDPNRPCLQR